MNENRKKTTNKLISTFDLPEDLFLGLSNISLLGNREVYISNHRGILSYGTDEMIIILKDYQFIIKGHGLNIVNYSKDDLVIQGHICSMEFV